MMTQKMYNKGTSVISGLIREPLTEAFAYDEKKFYTTTLAIPRLSKEVDLVPTIISGPTTLRMGMTVTVYGQVRSVYFTDRNERVHRRSYFFADIVYPKNDSRENKNEIIFSGFIDAVPVYRITPFGREITDLEVKIPRGDTGRFDNISCIAWGETAQKATKLSVGQPVYIKGRFQSREYVKKFPDGEKKLRTAYEVSINTLDVLDVNEETMEST